MTQVEFPSSVRKLFGFAFLSLTGAAIAETRQATKQATSESFMATKDARLAVRVSQKRVWKISYIAVFPPGKDSSAILLG